MTRQPRDCVDATGRVVGIAIPPRPNHSAKGWTYDRELGHESPDSPHTGWSVGRGERK